MSVRKWTLQDCWAAVMIATHELDVVAISRDQYRAWRFDQPDRGRFPPLNTIDIVLLDYGITAFHQPSARIEPSDMKWSRHTCARSVAISSADTIVGYKTWRARQDNPDAHPAWSIINRKVGGWSGVQRMIGQQASPASPPAS